MWSCVVWPLNVEGLHELGSRGGCRVSPDHLGDTSAPCSFEDRPGVVASAWRSGEKELEARTECRIEVLGAAQPSPVCLLLCCRGHRLGGQREPSGFCVVSSCERSCQGTCLVCLDPLPRFRGSGSAGMSKVRAPAPNSPVRPSLQGPEGELRVVSSPV